MIQEQLHIKTQGRMIHDITHAIQSLIAKHAIDVGLCHVFIHHTSASLIICENYDPAVLVDLNTFMEKLIPDGNKSYTHTSEGPDDMAAHLRSILTHSSITIPITKGQLQLGTWQGIYLWEHRASTHQRKLTVTLQN